MPPERDPVAFDVDKVRRCAWSTSDDLYRSYHDQEWGRPVVDEFRCYAKLCLEGFQAGLSLITILRKREAFRRAFSGFDPQAVARFGADEVDKLMADPSIVRNRAKIEAAITNAQATLSLIETRGSLAALLWSFEPVRRGRPAPVDWSDLPAATPESNALSAALRRAGFRFVGPTTCYATMQSLGIVNDHFRRCDMRSPCEQERRAVKVPSLR